MRNEGLALPGLDGANPLGFLAALGTVLAAEDGGENGVRLGWRRETTWRPVLYGLSATEEDRFSELVTSVLRGRPVPEDAEAKRKEAQRAFEEAKTLAKKKADEIKSRKLPREERDAAIQSQLEPLRARREECRSRWLQALRRSVPSPELSIGKHLDCTAAEYRELALKFLEEASLRVRRVVDLMAAFGNDACVKGGSIRADDRIEPTPFCFTAGSGQQYFLETAGALMAIAEVGLLKKTLFSPWLYDDQGHSMRWDPVEDRRYALMDKNPSSSGSKATTMWMADLLAYRALVLFPSAPGRRGLETTGWNPGGRRDAQRFLTWPIWEPPLFVDAIRSLLQLEELPKDAPDLDVLRARGIAAVFRAERIRVPPGPKGKLNFTPARAIL